MAKRSKSEQFDVKVEAMLRQSTAPVPEASAAETDLIELAGQLRDLPRTAFKNQLEAELARRASAMSPATSRETMPTESRMPSTDKRVNPIRAGFHTVTPYLIVNEAVELIDFVKQVFLAEEQFRSIGSAGGLHCELRVGDSMVMIGGGGAWRGTPTPTALHVYVPDVDAVYERSLEAGAASLRPPADQEYGDRDASVRDPYGNHWYIGTHKGKSSAQFIPSGLHSVNVYLHPEGAEQVMDFLKQAFGAEEMERAQGSDGVIHHAKLRMGTSVMELSEARAEFPPMPPTLYLYVEDCDTLYRQAVAAGAVSLSAPADQPYGDRNAGVQDPFGNTWYLSTHIRDVKP